MIVFKGGGRTTSGARTGLGKGFSGLASYLKAGSREAADPDRVAWVSCRHLAGVEDPSHAAQIMRAHASAHPRTENPVYHFGLSLNPGEHLTRQQWDDAVDRVLQRMGLEGHQAVVVAHRDTAKEHVHVVVNRVGPDGRAWDVHNDKIKARESIREIEVDYGLLRTGVRDPSLPDITPGAYQRALRTGEQPFVDRAREQTADAFATAVSWSDLEARLAASGFTLSPAARGSGLLLSDGERTASLSHVDRDLSGPKLAQRFGESFRAHRETLLDPALHRPPQPQPSRPAGETLAERVDALLARATATHATFTEAQLRRAAFHDPDGAALVQEALRSTRIVNLGQDARGRCRYTTRDYLDAEVRLLAAAAELASKSTFRLEPGTVSAILDRAVPALSAEQRAAVVHATTGPDLSQIVGRAGAGKTTAARALAEAYRVRGYDVRGAALAGKAAEVLQAETGVPSRTLASLEIAWSKGADRLHGRSVLIVDEAGMVDVRQLGRILAEAREQGAKVVLVGDPDQLKAIGAGDAFRGLLEHYPSAQIDTIRRQHEPWQRSASEDLAGGRIASALDRYDEAGRLHWTNTPAEARAALLRAYLHDRQQEPEAARLILAYRNSDVAQINDAIREARKATHELGHGVDVGRVELSSTDRVLFRRNESRDVISLDAATPAGVKNGTLGTVLSAEPHRIAVRLDDGRVVAFDPARYDAVAHGYAVTIHKAQGATTERTYVLADAAMNRTAAYVALTRHRQGVDLFADRETFPSREHLDRTLSRSDTKDLATDYAAAELGRAVHRLQDLAEKTRRATAEERPLREALAALEALREARLEVAGARLSVQKAAGAVYVDPDKALRGLLRDPGAADRLRRGEARAYGPLRRERRGDPRQEPTQPRAALLSLTGRLDAYQRSVAGVTAKKQVARAQLQALPDRSPRFRTVPVASTRTAALRLPRPKLIQRELSRVVAALRAYQRASQGAHLGVETALRGMSHATLNAALLLLPPQVSLPVGFAARAVSKVLEKGADLMLGR